jgi:ankyrin repeat protein
MVNLLYRHGADPSILNSYDQSPLHIAGASSRLPIVQELFSLTQSSLLEMKDYQGRTVLSITTHPDIIDELITYNADISSLDNNHMNALMIAVANQQLSIVEHLLFAISDKSVKIFDQVDKRSNRSVFLIAVQTGYIDMCSLLLTSPYIRYDTIDKQRMNIFHIAARNNHHELIQFLSEQIRKSDKLTTMISRSYSVVTPVDADIIVLRQTSSVLRVYIDAQNEDGKTPLHLAAEHGHRSSIKMLLKYGAEVLLPNYLGQLALHAAIQNGHSACVDILLKACTRNMADFQSVLSRRQSPLIAACQNGFVDIVQLLLSQQIGLDYEMDSGQEDNPLEIAIKYRRIDTIHVLLEHPHTEQWLMTIRKTKKNLHRTPLRDLIEYIPECAKHAFDKLILKTTEADLNGNTFERITYKYKYIDDYFM